MSRGPYDLLIFACLLTDVPGGNFRGRVLTRGALILLPVFIEIHRGARWENWETGSCHVCDHLPGSMSFFWHSGVGRIRWHFQSEQCGVLVLDINWQPQNEMARSVMKTHVSDLLSPPLVCDYIIVCTQHAWLVSESSTCGALSDCDAYVSEGICYRQIR